MLKCLEKIYFKEEQAKVKVVLNQKSIEIDSSELYQILLNHINSTVWMETIFKECTKTPVPIKVFASMLYGSMCEGASEILLESCIPDEEARKLIEKFFEDDEQVELFIISLSENLSKSISEDFGKGIDEIQKAIAIICVNYVIWQIYGYALKECVKTGRGNLVLDKEVLNGIENDSKETLKIIKGFNTSEYVSEMVPLILHKNHLYKRNRVQKKHVERVMSKCKKILTIQASRNPKYKANYKKYIKYVDMYGKYVKSKFCNRKS